MKKTVLILDDDEQLRFLLQRAVESFGYKVLTASNGREALQQVRYADVQLVDLGLPDMSGQMYIKIVERCGVKIPTIIVTGSCFEDSNYKVVPKPYARDEIQQALAEAI